MRKLLPVLLLSACAAPQAQTQPSGACRGDGLAVFVGREANEETLSQLQAASGAHSRRVVQPGMMVTMEFSPDRLTVQLAPGNRIERVSCG